MSQVSLTFGTYIKRCPIRLNISCKYYDFGLNSYRLSSAHQQKSREKGGISSEKVGIIGVKK